jgi:multiple antibiotic resistance protein
LRHIQERLPIAPSTAIGIILTVILGPVSGAQASESFRSSIASGHVDLGEAFTFFFLMLGPMKILAPFVKMTEGTEDRFRRQLAVRATIFSCVALTAGTLVGEKT